jgi:sugar lactone lactonase YvrE
MNRFKYFFVFLGMLALLLTACSSNAPTQVSAPPENKPIGLGDGLVKKLGTVTQSNNFQTPLDSTPDLDGTNIYFTATGSHGTGVFKVAATGSTASEIFVGKPFVNPRGIAISPDGKNLFIADPTADQIFHLTIAGGQPTPLHGSKGTSPQNLNIVIQDKQQVIYFTGKDPISGQPAVLKLPVAGASAATSVFKGFPFVAPDGVIVTHTGIIYVSDRAATGKDTGKVFKIQNGVVTTVVEHVHLGAPAGIALSPDESILLVSALQQENSHDQVLLVNAKTLQTGSVTKVVGQNINDAGGLHASPGRKELFSWCGLSAGGHGSVYVVSV